MKDFFKYTYRITGCNKDSYRVVLLSLMGSKLSRLSSPNVKSKKGILDR